MQPLRQQVQFAARAQREADLLATVDEALKPSELRLELTRTPEVRQ